MKATKAIKTSNLPVRSPEVKTVLTFLCLDYWSAPEWLWGVFGLFWLIIWIVCFVRFFNQEEVDIFEDKPPLIDQFEEMSKFNQKLQELLDKNKKKANESN